MRKFALAVALLVATPALAEGDADFQQRYSDFLKQYADAWNKNSASGIAAAYAADGVLIRPDGVVLRGGAAVGKFVEWEHSQGEHDVNIGLTAAHKIGDAAYAYGPGELLFGDKNQKLAFNWSATYALDGDKIAVKMLAISLPPPPPAK